MPLTADVWTLIVILFLLIVSCNRTIVTAVSCYQCNSFSDPACLGSSLDQFKDTCKTKAIGCRKILYKLDIPGTGDLQERIVRQCAKTRNQVGCISLFGTNGKRYKQTTCECNGDYCNVTTRSRSHTLLVYMVSLVTLIVVS